MSWQSYVDDHLMCDVEGNHLTSAAILGQDGSVWAQSSNFPQDATDDPWTKDQTHEEEVLPMDDVHDQPDDVLDQPDAPLLNPSNEQAHDQSDTPNFKPEKDQKLNEDAWTLPAGPMTRARAKRLKDVIQESIKASNILTAPSPRPALIILVQANEA